MARLPLLAVAVALFFTSSAAAAVAWIEPRMKLHPDVGPPTVALTFDACGGKVDRRILDVLLAEKIPATIFVTSIWMRRNPKELAELLAHPDLFDIENHGRHHLPAVDKPIPVYGLKAAGSADAVLAEMNGGAEDIKKATGRDVRWYRGAAAVYSDSSLKLIAAHEKVAGYSIAADGGTLLSKAGAKLRTEQARDGDVLLAHINHPEKTAGEGVALGIVELKRRGYRFVKLNSPGLRYSETP